MITKHRIPLPAIFIVPLLTVVAGCKSTSSVLVTAPPPIELHTFVDEIPGTGLSIVMQPITGGAVAVETTEGSTNEVVASFWMSQYEVPWELFDVFVYNLDTDELEDAADLVTRPTRPYVMVDRGFGHNGYPAISMSYEGARLFAKWIAEKTGRQYALPTQSQWILACISGGHVATDADTIAWHKGNSDGTTHPCGSQVADANKIHDLWGNVAEWSIDSDGKPLAIGGGFRSTLDQIGPDATDEPSPAWNQSDPQIPRSIWWLADNDAIGIRLICTPAPQGIATENLP
jgi:hypothetical protein